MKKINVGIVFGGKSSEHEISILSAKNVIAAINQEKYDLTLIGIDRLGQWRSVELEGLMSGNVRFLDAEETRLKLAVQPGHSEKFLVPAVKGKSVKPVEVIFPVLHGQYGEDGTVQGLLKLAGVPFVGCGVLGAALGMDKDMAKRILRDAGIAVANFLTFHSWQKDEIQFQTVAAELGLPLFIKPANAGSSVGVSKVQDSVGFYQAMEDAFCYDHKILMEECIIGREVECAVLGNEQPIASTVGEIVVKREFYSYEAKYLDEEGAVLAIPASLPDDLMVKIQRAAVAAFRALALEGLARIDFFLAEDGRVIVNEVNTMPGFTANSMYPKLWEASGISYTALLDHLIELALARQQREERLQTGYAARPGKE